MFLCSVCFIFVLVFLFHAVVGVRVCFLSRGLGVFYLVLGVCGVCCVWCVCVCGLWVVVCVCVGVVCWCVCVCVCCGGVCGAWVVCVRVSAADVCDGRRGAVSAAGCILYHDHFIQHTLQPHSWYLSTHHLISPVH